MSLRDAVELPVVGDPEDPAVRRGRRERAEDRRAGAGTTARDHDRKAAAQAIAARPADRRRRTATRRSPGSQRSVQEEGQGERDAQQHAVVARQGRQPDQRRRRARTPARSPAQAAGAGPQESAPRSMNSAKLSGWERYGVTPPGTATSSAAAMRLAARQAGVLGDQPRHRRGSGGGQPERQGRGERRGRRGPR